MIEITFLSGEHLLGKFKTEMLHFIIMTRFTIMNKKENNTF